MLIVWRTRLPKGPRAVAKTMLATITAFTAGHSVTLAAATLGLVRLRLGPTEVVIALSVLLLAVELARDDRSTLTMRFPWVVAFAFGLLHGFGFAGALAEIGLPPDGIAVPLLLFNLGVEAGQLAAWRHDGFWQGMDTLRDKNHLEQLWTSGKAPWKKW